MKSNRHVLKRVAIGIFGLAIIMVMVLTAIIALSFMIQMEVRNDIRKAKAEVLPVVFANADCGDLNVRESDLFVFCLKSGEIRPARKTDARYDFMGSLLRDFNVGTNRIFVMVDRRCSMARREEIAGDFSKICSNKVYLVGIVRDDAEKMACVEWSGQLPENGLQGTRLDGSVIDSLLYVSPFVCNPLVGWFGDMVGMKCKVQSPWRSRCERVSSDSIFDLYPEVASNVVTVRAWSKRDSANPDVIYLDVSYYIDLICGKDPTIRGYEQRSFALRCISKIRKLAKEDVEELMAYLRSADDEMCEEHVVKLKNNVINLLRNQDPAPEGLAETLIGMLEDGGHPTGVLQLCVQHLGALTGELDDAALLKHFSSAPRYSAAAEAAIKRIKRRAEAR